MVYCVISYSLTHTVVLQKDKTGKSNVKVKPTGRPRTSLEKNLGNNKVETTLELTINTQNKSLKYTGEYTKGGKETKRGSKADMFDKSKVNRTGLKTSTSRLTG